MQINKIKLYGEYFLKTILEIIEDQPNYSVSLNIYIFMVIWHFVQITGYLYSDQARVITEQYQAIVVLIEYISTGTYLLFFKGSNNLTLVILATMQAIMYFYFIYVGFLTYIKYNNQKLINSNKETFSSINHFLNTFFVVYQWIFFIPYFEINSGTFSCSPQSFFPDQRDPTQCTLSIVQTIFSTIGNILSILTSLIIIFFFRNYEFNERNLLKRRYHFLLIPQLIVYFIIVFFTLTNPITLVIKYFFLQVLVLSQMYDLLWNLPFRNPTIIKAYAISIIFFEVTCVVYTYLMLQPSQSDAEMIYQTMLFGALASSVLMVSWYYRYEGVLQINEQNFSQRYRFMDFYLEEMFRLTQLSESDKYSKYKIQEIVLSHQDFCTNVLCHCHTLNIKVTRKAPSNEDILLLIESIFSWGIKQSVLQKDKSESEHISLKYISFIAKYLNNSTSAFYELKILLQQEKNPSFYFRSISEILERHIEMMMEERIQREALISNDSAGMSVRELLKNYNEQEKRADIFIPIFKQFTQNKIDFWNKVKDPQLTLRALNSHVLSLSESCQSTIKHFSNYFQTQNLSHWSTNVLSLKIFSIYKGLVQNQIGHSRLYEQSVMDIIGKDLERHEELLTSLNLMEGNIIFIQVSLAKKRGKILNSKKDKILWFFGYNYNESHCAEDINQLMPNIFASLHNDLMFNMIHQGYSKLFNGDHYTYAKDKNGFIFPVKIQIDYLNTVTDDFVLNGCILKYKTPNQTILIDENGNIEGLTEDIYKIIISEIEHANSELEQVSFTQRINILLLIPQLVEVFERKMYSRENSNESTNEDFANSNSRNEVIALSEKLMLKVSNNFRSMVKQYNDFIKTASQSEKQSVASQKSLQRLPTKTLDDKVLSKTIQQFQQFFSKHRAQWEYFNSRHISIICNIEKRSLNVLQDRRRDYGIHKVYYIITITDIEHMHECISPGSPLFKRHQSKNKTILSALKNQIQQKAECGPSLFSEKALAKKSNLENQTETQQLSRKENNIGSITSLNEIQNFNFLLSDNQIKETKEKPSLEIKQDLIHFTNSQIDIQDDNLNSVRPKKQSNSKLHQRISFDKKIITNSLLKNKLEAEEKRTFQNQTNESSNDEKVDEEMRVTEEHQINFSSFQQKIENTKYFHNNLEGLNQYAASPLSNTIQFSSNNFMNSPFASNHLMMSPPAASNHIQFNFILDSERVKDSATNREELVETANLVNWEQLKQDGQNSTHDEGKSSQKEARQTISTPSLNKLEEVEQQQQVKLQRKQTIVKSKKLIQKNISVMNYMKKSIKLTNNQDNEEFDQKESTDENETPNIIKFNQNNQNNDHASLSSYKSSQKVFDNDVIQQIVSQKTPKILTYFYLLLQIRFFLFILTICVISVITLVQINTIQDEIKNPQQISQLFSQFSNINLDALKIYEINKNLIDSDVAQEYYVPLSNGLPASCLQYQSTQINSFNILNKLRSMFGEPTINALMFSLNSKLQHRIDLMEFLFKTLNSVLGISEYPTHIATNFLYFLNGNFYEFSVMLDTFIGTLNNEIYDLNSQLKSQYLIFAAIILIYLFLILLFGYIIVSRINTYSEKVLLLISRLSVSEIDKEVNMLEYCKIALQSEDSSWRSTNFPNIIIQRDHHKIHHHHNQYLQQQQISNNQDPKKTMKKGSESNSHLHVKKEQHQGDLSFKKEHLHTKVTQSSDRNSKTRQRKLTENSKYKSQSNIASLLQGQTLQTWPFYLVFTFILLMCGAFFVIVIFLAYISSRQLDPGLDFMNDSTKINFLISKSIFLSEYIAINPIMQQVDTHYPDLYNSTIINDFQSSISNLTSLMTNILSDINGLQSTSNLDKEYFSNLLSADMCTFFPTDPICSSTDLSPDQSYLQSIASHGISSFISTYQTLFKNLNYIMNISDATQQISQINLYLSNDETVGLIYNSFSLPMKSLNLFLTSTIQYSNDLINQLKQITLIYFLIIGLVLIFIQIIADYNLKLRMKRKIRKLNLALSFIPIPIAQEEVTGQILKSIYSN